MLRRNTNMAGGENHGLAAPSQPMPVPRVDGAAVEAVRIAACLAQIEAFAKAAWAPRIQFNLVAGADLPLLICHRASLEAAIMSLLFNARDAMPDGGAISVIAAAVDEGPPAIALRVVDTGFGMTADTVARATDPYFTTKSTGLGGLGLPMVERFAEDNGGRLEIESEPGAGTTVTLLLPLPEVDAERLGRRATSSPGSVAARRSPANYDQIQAG